MGQTALAGKHRESLRAWTFFVGLNPVPCKWGELQAAAMAMIAKTVRPSATEAIGNMISMVAQPEAPQHISMKI